MVNNIVWHRERVDQINRIEKGSIHFGTTMKISSVLANAFVISRSNIVCFYTDKSRSINSTFRPRVCFFFLLFFCSTQNCNSKKKKQIFFFVSTALKNDESSISNRNKNSIWTEKKTSIVHYGRSFRSFCLCCCLALIHITWMLCAYAIHAGGIDATQPFASMPMKWDGYCCCCCCCLCPTTLDSVSMGVCVRVFRFILFFAGRLLYN